MQMFERKSSHICASPRRVPFSTQVYPPPVVIDATLLPPLEDNQGDAMKKIMGSVGQLSLQGGSCIPELCL